MCQNIYDQRHTQEIFDAKDPPTTTTTQYEHSCINFAHLHVPNLLHGHAHLSQKWLAHPNRLPVPLNTKTDYLTKLFREMSFSRHFLLIFLIRYPPPSDATLVLVHQTCQWERPWLVHSNLPLRQLTNISIRCPLRERSKKETIKQHARP